MNHKNYKNYDIVVELNIKGNDGIINPQVISHTLDNLENSLYDSDREDIEQASERFHFPKIIMEASMERLRKHRHNRILFREVKNGSIILKGVVAGVSLMVLRDILEDAKDIELIRETNQNEIVEFYKERIERKAFFIADKIERNFYQKKRDVKVKVINRRHNEPITIKVISGKDNKRKLDNVKSLGDLLD